MEKQYIKENNEKLNAKKEDLKEVHKHETKEEKAETTEIKAEETKAEKKKSEKKEIAKKEKAVVRGNDLPISKKHSMAVGDFIRYKDVDSMIPELEKVIKLQKAIPMKGEIPHRKGKIMSGRYPVNACKVFVKLLKTLSANSSVNGIENPIVSVVIANDASRPFKRGGSARFKRTNVYLEARERKVKIENKQDKEKK